MSENTPTQPGEDGLTRRDLLRKGAILGGALAWSIPTVQTFRMAPAFAAATSHAVSYVAMVLQCGDAYYQAKWEVGGSWSDGGALPCGDHSSQSWPSYDYSSLHDIQPLPDPSRVHLGEDKYKYTFDFRGKGCTVIWSINKCAQTCESGETGDVVTFSPCPA